MPNYKAHCAYLVYTIEYVLTLMEDDNLLQWDTVKGILRQSLLDLKEQISENTGDSEEETENDEIPRNS